MYAIGKIAALAAVLAAGALAQDTSKENQVGDRGQIRTSDETQTLDRGRVGTQDSVPNKPLTLLGVLVDAGCRDRSSLNLKQAPQNPALPEESQEGPKPGEGQRDRQGRSRHGVSVDPKTADAERSDVMPHHVPDVRARQMDPTCAITGETRNYALLMDNGRLLDLDEGGNTKANQALQSSEAGRKMLNGNGPGLKPRVAITGRIQGDHAVVSKLKIE